MNIFKEYYNHDNLIIKSYCLHGLSNLVVDLGVNY